MHEEMHLRLCQDIRSCSCERLCLALHLSSHIVGFAKHQKKYQNLILWVRSLLLNRSEKDNMNPGFASNACQVGNGG